MHTDLGPAITKLGTGEMLRIDKARGQSITIMRGMVWLTQEGDHRDVFLCDGESFVFNRRGTALVEAITDTHLLAFVGEAAELIDNPAAIPVSSSERQREKARVRLLRELATRVALFQAPAHRLG